MSAHVRARRPRPAARVAIDADRRVYLSRSPAKRGQRVWRFPTSPCFCVGRRIRRTADARTQSVLTVGDPAATVCARRDPGGDDLPPRGSSRLSVTSRCECE